MALAPTHLRFRKGSVVETVSLLHTNFHANVAHMFTATRWDNLFFFGLLGSEGRTGTSFVGLSKKRIKFSQHLHVESRKSSKLV